MTKYGIIIDLIMKILVIVGIIYFAYDNVLWMI